MRLQPLDVMLLERLHRSPDLCCFSEESKWPKMKLTFLASGIDKEAQAAPQSQFFWFKIDRPIRDLEK